MKLPVCWRIFTDFSTGMTIVSAVSRSNADDQEQHSGRGGAVPQKIEARPIPRSSLSIRHAHDAKNHHPIRVLTKASMICP